MFAARARSPSISASAASSEVPPAVGAPAGAAAGRDGVSPMRAGRGAGERKKLVGLSGTDAVARRLSRTTRNTTHDATLAASIARAARGRARYVPARSHHGICGAARPRRATERLSDVGIASDDATVEDVLRKAVPARFVRLGAHLASDVAAVVATGCVGVDDREGVVAATSAIYRSAANAANNPGRRRAAGAGPAATRRRPGRGGRR